MHRFLIILALALLMAVPPASAQIPDWSTQPASPFETELLGQLIKRLGDPRFAVRAQATEQFSQCPSEWLPELVRQYRAESCYEIKRALRHAIEHSFFRQQMAGEVGFIGIGPMPVSGVIDPADGRLIEALRVERVLKGFSAAEAGLEKGDLIVEIDGRPVTALFNAQSPLALGSLRMAMILQPHRTPTEVDQKLSAFTAEIKQRRPGSRMKLRVLRGHPPGDEVEYKELPGTETPPRTGIEGTQWLVTPTGNLQVERVDENSPAEKFGLRADDIVIAVYGREVPPGTNVEALTALLVSRRPRETPDHASPAAMTVLRKKPMRQLHISLTVAGRPPDLLNPIDRIVAQARFATWWLRQGGELNIRRPEATWMVTIPDAAIELSRLPGGGVLP